MIVEPLEEQAIVAVVDLLESMTDLRPWGGNYPNPPRLERELPTSIAGIGQCPLLVVTLAVDAGGPLLGENVQGVVIAGGSIGYQNTFVFDVVGYVQGTADAKADTWCLRLRKDVLDTLCARAEAIPGVSQARSLWPIGSTEIDPGVLGEHLRAFRQSYAIVFDDVMTLG